MPTLRAIVAADATIRRSKVAAADLRPGDRVLVHRAPPGEIFCSIPVTGTVVAAYDAQPERIYPKPCDWHVEILQDDGETYVFNCSPKYTGCLRADVNTAADA